MYLNSLEKLHLLIIAFFHFTLHLERSEIQAKFV